MGAFSNVERSRPPGNVNVPPEAFSSTWHERPESAVCIGLRYLPDVDLEDARVEAYRRASTLFPDHAKTEETTQLFVASFQDALLRWVVARGTCDPNDVDKPWESWAAAPEDMVKEVLTDHGAQLIFDAWEQMRIAADIGLRPATDADLALLPDLLQRLPSVRATSRTQELRLRRLLRYVLEELETATPPPSPT